MLNFFTKNENEILFYSRNKDENHQSAIIISENQKMNIDVLYKETRSSILIPEKKIIIPNSPELIDLHTIVSIKEHPDKCF